MVDDFIYWYVDCVDVCLFMEDFMCVWYVVVVECEVDVGEVVVELVEVECEIYDGDVLQECEYEVYFVQQEIDQCDDQYLWQYDCELCEDFVFLFVGVEVMCDGFCMKLEQCEYWIVW